MLVCGDLAWRPTARSPGPLGGLHQPAAAGNVATLRCLWGLRAGSQVSSQNVPLPSELHTSADGRGFFPFSLSEHGHPWTEHLAGHLGGWNPQPWNRGQEGKGLRSLDCSHGEPPGTTGSVPAVTSCPDPWECIHSDAAWDQPIDGGVPCSPSSSQQRLAVTNASLLVFKFFSDFLFLKLKHVCFQSC